MSRPLILAAITLVSSTLLSACAPMASSAEAEALTPRQLAVLDRNLGGKVAGDPVRCIPTGMSQDTIRVSDTILLYRSSGRLVYKNDLRGGCPGLSRDNDVIVSEIRGPGPCSGDIIHLVDRTTGIRGPSCVLGEFTPYRTPSDGN